MKPRPEPIKGAAFLSLVFLFVVYLAPWCPFFIAAFYTTGWWKLACALAFVFDPFSQAIFIAAVFGVD